MRRQKIRMRLARTATKVQEKELVSKAKRLMENPELVLPECNSSCKHCAFEKIKKQIQKIQHFKEDEKKLTKFSRKGNSLARAYAGTLLIAHAEKAPIFAVAKLPQGDVTYVTRGKTKKEKLIGVQHFDKPELRLVGIEDIARKKGIHIYSIKNKMICTGKKDKPPKEFIEEQIYELKVQSKGNGIYGCSHLTLENIKGREFFGKPFLIIEWLPAKITIAICNNCSKGNSYGLIAKRIAGKDIEKNFNINVSWHPICKVSCDSCRIENLLEVESDIVNEYLKREITNKKFIEKHLKKVKERLKEGERVFIADNKCYGNDIGQFIKSLNPTEDEKLALLAVLEKYEKPILIEKPTPSKVLSILWDFGEEAIYAVTKDREIAKKLYKKSKSKNPSQILIEAKNEAVGKEILSALPKYKKLPNVANFANRVARAYKTRSKEEAIKIVEKEETKDTKVKAVGFAFLLNFDNWKGKEWLYTEIEREYAEYLKEFTKKLLDATPEKYHEALQELLRASGSTEIIEKV